ncbi:hypothetical protein F5Y04DRAFT_246752 [Hypomontagnella monticulosa]|nr:hypothetical protein F5Y04DRAFT_246752 [Hypomontagnella monticulosa]
MRCQHVSTLSLLAGLLAGVMAGESLEMRQDPQTGVFARQDGANLQRFQAPPGGFIGDQNPPEIVYNDGPDSDQKPFKVVGGTEHNGDGGSFNDTRNFVCDEQKNLCSKFVNGPGKGTGPEVSDCDKQREQCIAANTASDQDADFVYFCDS